SGVWVSTSQDHGDTWSEAIVSMQPSDAVATFTGTSDGFADLAVDVDSDDRAFVVWDRPQYASYAPVAANLFFSRTSDGGATWDAPKQIYDTTGALKKTAQAAGVTLLQTSKKSLVTSFMRYYDRTAKSESADRVVLRSTDEGHTWDKKATVVSSF